MLSIGKMSGGQEEYYLSLVEGYYTQGGEPQGRWMGTAASKLGLEGLVSGEHLRNLFRGKAPSGSHFLVQTHQGPERKPHCPGWDCTFSAPKSVSVLWGLGDEDLRARIEQAHLDAIAAGVKYLETTASFTRRGKDGHARQTTDLLVACFEHSTSRLLDPHLHTHALVLNVGTRPDGTTGTVLSNPLFRHKMAAGALYRAELAALLSERLGVTVEMDREFFALRDVPKPLADFFSKRRQQIEDTLRGLGYESAAAAAVATLTTREAKVFAPREQLFSQWKRIGAEFGWTVAAALGHDVSRRPEREEARLREELKSVVKELCLGQSTFTEHEIVEHAAVLAQGMGLRAARVLEVARGFLRETQDIVPLGQLHDAKYYTTRQTLEVEKNLLRNVEASLQDRVLTVRPSTVEKVLAEIDRQRARRKEDPLSAEQRAAIEHITLRPGSIQMIDGLAGTGKTTILAAAREVWEREGYRVVGAALAATAAKNLEKGSGIQSTTLARWLWSLDRTFFSDVKHHLTQLTRAALRLPTTPLPSLRLDGKTVMVLDEAAMNGTHAMNALVANARKAGAKIVAAGDDLQLQPITAGGPFAEMKRTLNAARLTEIRRQREEWAREAVTEMANGQIEKALSRFAEHGQLRVSESREQSLDALFAEWKKAGLKNPKDHLIITGTNEDARELNQRAQKEHIGNRYLRSHRTVVSEPDERDQRTQTTFYTGDRIVFRKNSTYYDVTNGDFGTIIGFSADRLRQTVKVKLDRGGTRTIRTDYYKDFELGYAVTTHRAQGATVENVYVLAGGSMQDRELSYVQVSRARDKAWIFAQGDPQAAVPKELVAEMSRSNKKEMATAVQERISDKRSAPPKPERPARPLKDGASTEKSREEAPSPDQTIQGAHSAKVAARERPEATHAVKDAPRERPSLTDTTGAQQTESHSPGTHHAAHRPTDREQSASRDRPPVQAVSGAPNVDGTVAAGGSAHDERVQSEPADGLRTPLMESAGFEAGHEGSAEVEPSIRPSRPSIRDLALPGEPEWEEAPSLDAAERAAAEADEAQHIEIERHRGGIRR